jgi:hypothetical protein
VYIKLYIKISYLAVVAVWAVARGLVGGSPRLITPQYVIHLLPLQLHRLGDLLGDIGYIRTRLATKAEA